MYFRLVGSNRGFREGKMLPKLIICKIDTFDVILIIINVH